MKRTYDSKFYKLVQNNSGGYYVVDEFNNKFVIIEALSYSQAEKFYNQNLNHSACCCCGERWNLEYSDKESLSEVQKWLKKNHWLLNDVDKDVNIFILTENVDDWKKIEVNEFLKIKEEEDNVRKLK